MFGKGAAELNAICQRFNSVKWHDSKLISVHVTNFEGHAANEVYFELKLLSNSEPGNYEWKEATLRMMDCTIIKMDLDLATKQVCADDIAGAHCVRESSLKERIEQEDLGREHKPLAEYLHFLIELIPPAGKINMFARDFELTFADEGSLLQ